MFTGLCYQYVLQSFGGIDRGKLRAALTTDQLSVGKGDPDAGRLDSFRETKTGIRMGISKRRRFENAIRAIEEAIARLPELESDERRFKNYVLHEFSEIAIQAVTGLTLEIEAEEEVLLTSVHGLVNYLPLTEAPSPCDRFTDAIKLGIELTSRKAESYLRERLEKEFSNTPKPYVVETLRTWIRNSSAFQNVLLYPVWKEMLVYTEDVLNARIEAERQMRELVISTETENDEIGLPPLIRILTDPETTHAQIGLLIEKLLPGFSHSSLSSQAQKSKFLAALTGKRAETFRSKWNDTFGVARLNSHRYRKTDGPAIKAFTAEIETYLKEKKLL